MNPDYVSHILMSTCWPMHRFFINVLLDFSKGLMYLLHNNEILHRKNSISYTVSFNFKAYRGCDITKINIKLTGMNGT